MAQMKKDKVSVEELEKSLSKHCHNTNIHIWIGRDFIFNRLQLERNCMKSGCNQPELISRLIDLMAGNGLTQVVTEPTFHQNTLDLFFTNNPTCVYNSNVIPGIFSDGHHTVYVECDITPIRNIQVPREIKLYSKTDREGLKDRMSTVKDSFMATHSNP